MRGWPLARALPAALLLAACAGGGDHAAMVETRLTELDLEARAALLVAVPLLLDSAANDEPLRSDATGDGSAIQPGAFWIEGASIEGMVRLQTALPAEWAPLVIASVDRGVGGVVTGATSLPRLYDLTRAGWDAEGLREAGRLLARESEMLGITLPLVSAPPVLGVPDPLFLVRDSAGLAERYHSLFEGAAESRRRLGVMLYWTPGPGHRASTWDRIRFEIVEGATRSGAMDGRGAAVALGSLSLPALDARGTPAAYSPSIIRGDLRRDAGFHGLVIADLRDRGPGLDPVDEIVAAVAAGADLVATRVDLATATAAIVSAVADGTLPASRVETAARRVLALADPQARQPGEALTAAAIRGRLAAEPSLRVRDDAFRFVGELGAGAAGAPEPGSSGPAASGVARRTPVPDSLGFDADDLAEIDQEMDQALEDSVLTGGAVVVIRNGGVAFARGYGTSSDGTDVLVDSTLFDLASLSKVVGTTTAAALLVDRGELVLDAPVRRYLPEFRGEEKQGVTIRHLLTHTSGLPSGLWVYGSASSREEALAEILEQPLVSEPGERVLYSDLGYILLAEVVERVAGTTLDRFLAARIFVPLGMEGTMYLPPSSLRGRVVATVGENERPYALSGVVHDANAFRLQGVAGHAGIFSTPTDVARFAQMMLDEGRLDGVRVLSDSIVTMFRTRQTGADERALGWDTPADVSSAGRFASRSTFGHTGYTGTSLWIDPDYGLAVVLLTNRTYPKASSSEILDLRTAVHEAVYQAITDREVPRRQGAR